MSHCSVGLVIGSAGFGKTTLLVQWREIMMKAGADVVWLALSADDKNLSTFYAYLMGALQRLGVIVDSEIPLGAASGDSIDEVVAAIVDGASGVNRELFLIIDDYHYVADPRSHRLMQKLLDHSPANLHFVIAARVQPPLSLSRLRLMGMVKEVDCANLPFDLAESRTFLEQNLAGLKLTAEEFHLIYGLTSGWPASLQLIVILLRSNPRSRERLQDLGWRSDDMQAYLAEDVMAHLPGEQADFMERVSVCRRFNAALAGAVTGSDKAGELLQRLEEENLLIFRVEAEDRQPWYRFHPLFGEFLTTRLMRREAAMVAELHRRAAHWFAERQLLAEAVRHATLGGDLEFAAQLIGRSAPTTWALNHLSPLLRLLDRLPQETLFSHPRLFFLGCLAYALTARPAKAEAWLEQFQQSGAAQHVDVAFRLPIVQAAIEIQHDRTEPIIGLLQGRKPLSDDYSVMRYGPSALLAIAYAAAGRHADAVRCLDDSPIPEQDRDDEMALVVEGSRTLCLLLEGRVRDAERSGSVQHARAVAVHGHRSVSAYSSASSLADAFYELDRIDEAREVLANRIGLMQWAMPETMIRATISRARLDLLQESPGAATAFLQRQERHFRTMEQDRGVVHCLAEELRIALLESDRATATDRLAKLEVLGTKHQASLGFQAEIPAVVGIARARLLLASNYPDKALQALAEVRAYTQQYSRGQMDVAALLLMAIAHADLRQHEQEKALLLQAVHQGCALGLVRTFLDLGPALGKQLGRLNDKLGEEGEVAGYLAELLARFNHNQSSNLEGEAGGGSAQSLLTPRELAVLQLISQAMSNKRVALTLNISLETVKWNLKNIYVKLGVSSRYDAVSWARNQGLIE
ncbi:LuxR C-terminal-related transcriptional regulator [Pseudomonas sp. GD03860]|nr:MULTISPECIES: LuxR C-terminal-related transcriptional regulator [Pseudomonas]MDD2058555.1 LuxR C-terminal-related transcriptional regulator [Pseudomonas putida]MDH0639580.1 LuxR C-terminal-related transcriptional regulator [Pseudomonas sp. GD03860]